jgi:hypothetical protein
MEARARRDKRLVERAERILQSHDYYLKSRNNINVVYNALVHDALFSPLDLEQLDEYLEKRVRAPRGMRKAREPALKKLKISKKKIVPKVVKHKVAKKK